jgi:DNA-binding transcriptional regulator YiaG
MDADTRGTGEQLDRAVVVGRAETAGDHEQIARQPVGERRFEIGRIVADNRDARRVDAEPKQRRCQERPVSVVPVAADGFRTLRESLGISQAEIAEMCGVSRAVVSDWERGKASLPPAAPLDSPKMSASSPVLTCRT